jgi:hypothetical protein
MFVFLMVFIGCIKLSYETYLCKDGQNRPPLTFYRLRESVHCSLLNIADKSFLSSMAMISNRPSIYRCQSGPSAS